MESLMRAPEFPKLKGWYVQPGYPPEKQINAFERDKQIFIPVETLRFLRDDPSALTFLIAHEAGHAKQEEIYGQSCYTAGNVKMSKFDWVRALADVAGGAATQGSSGAFGAMANMQKQACEDGADAWAVKFMREAGLDATSGLRLFEKFMQLPSRPGWQHFAEQFTSDHSINELRIAHITALILQKRSESSGTQANGNPAIPSSSGVALHNQTILPAGTEVVVSLDKWVSSTKDAQTGQTIGCRVAEDVLVQGKTLIPKNSKVTLSLVIAKVVSFKLWLKIDSVEVSGKTYTVSGDLSDQTSAVSRTGDVTLPAETRLRFALKLPLIIQ